MRFLFFVLLSTSLFAQFGSQDTGGILIPEQSCYDVKFYSINLNIDPEDKAISGWVEMKADIVVDASVFVLNLDTTYRIVMIKGSINDLKKEKLLFKNIDGKILINLPQMAKAGDKIEVDIHYSGKPRVPVRPPWDDGFIWSKTPNGKDWIGVTCQGGGADIWWPCKDHPSDEPDSVELNFTIPSGLICASNGRLSEVTDNGNGTTTFNWFVSTPINNYGISVHIAPYDTIQYKYESVTGETIPVTIWVLPENIDKAKLHSPQFLEHLKYFEAVLGPYPFRADKYGVAETPYLGMEHQTIIANGFGYKNGEDGFDWLHHHELAHEWFGNMVTAKDWSDFWIHEATAGYMQALYTEKLNGIDVYHKFQQRWMNWKNQQPIAPRQSMTGGEAYTYDMYAKGSWVIHTLRYYLGKETILKILRRWCYPDPDMEKISDGRQCRFATTDDFLKIAEEVSGKKLDWFWEVYFRQASLPVLSVDIDQDNSKMHLKWKTENNINFPLPVEVKFGDQIKRIEMINGEATVEINRKIKPEIDPYKWITMAPVEIK